MSHALVGVIGSALQDVELPELPSNAKYLHHPNECYDWGTFGWALKQENVQVSDYKYFIFLNSSVRGPFLPPYLQVRRATALYVGCIAGNHIISYFVTLCLGVLSRWLNRTKL